MLTLTERIQALQAATGWTETEIAKIAGVTQSAVSQWLGNGSKVIKTIGNIDAAHRLQAKSGFSAVWLARGTGPRMYSESQSDAKVVKYPKQGPWPFRIDYRRFEALAPDERAEVEADLVHSIERIEARRKARKRAGTGNGTA